MQILPNIDEPLRYLLICVQCQGQTPMDLFFSFESGYKILLIFLIIDYPALFYPTHYNVMECSG